jgi:DNA-binding transcriptional ArsR family regulator
VEIATTLRALAALAQETRLRIFRLLVEHGPDGLPAGSIARSLALPAATLSFHVKELANAGLVSARPQGRQVHYSADFAEMHELVAFLTENCCRAVVSPGDCRVECEPHCVPAQAAPAIPKPNVRPKRRFA